MLYLDVFILTHVKMEMSPNGAGICGGEHNVWKPRKEVGLEISKEWRVWTGPGGIRWRRS